MTEVKQTRTYPTEFTVQIDAENKAEFCGPDAKAIAEAYACSITPVEPRHLVAQLRRLAALLLLACGLGAAQQVSYHFYGVDPTPAATSGGPTVGNIKFWNAARTHAAIVAGPASLAADTAFVFPQDNGLAGSCLSGCFSKPQQVV